MNNDLSEKKSSSFVKLSSGLKPTTLTAHAKTSSAINIPGCKFSVQNSQLLTSIGIPSIDYFIGGGLPIGSVCLIGEDKFNVYSDMITRCFIAEGIQNKHAIFIANQLAQNQNLLQRVPDLSVTKESEHEKNEEIKLRIAWRYGEKSARDDSKSHQANYFQLNRYMSQEAIVQADVKLFESQNLNENLYQELADQIKAKVDTKFNVLKTKEYTNIMRILINAAGSALWNDSNDESLSNNFQLFHFLIYLRNLLRNSLAICLITVQDSLLKNQNFLFKLVHLSDFVFTLDESDLRLAKTQYDGLFRILKLSSLNALNTYLPETLDLAFHVKRKRFVVEIFHLPPEIDEESDEKKGRTTTSAMACATKTSSKLDF